MRNVSKEQKEIKEKLISQYLEKKDTYESLGKKLVDLIKDMMKCENIDYQTITHRIKDEKSFDDKITKKQKYDDEKKKYKYSDINDITDVCGIRIITSYSDTVYRVAEVISKQFKVDEENTIDKIKAMDPDKFGYLSLHYVISLNEERFKLTEYSKYKDMKVEIQIRSISQHAWAEIEHDLGYKNEVTVPREIRRDFYRLAGLLELVDKEFIDIREKLSLYKNDIEKHIDKPEKDIYIDSVSLKLYIKNSDYFDKLCEQISIELNLHLSNTYIEEYDYSRLIKSLNYAGFNTIQEIDKFIIENKNEISNYAKITSEFNNHEILYKILVLWDVIEYTIFKNTSYDGLYKYLVESNETPLNVVEDSIARLKYLIS